MQQAMDLSIIYTFILIAILNHFSVLSEIKTQYTHH
jgi:nucleoside recognition membrane protein YjiH